MIACVFDSGMTHLTLCPKQLIPINSFSVLNSARKHKYPEKCSALPSWREDIPLDFDLEISKVWWYFTVEEVKDVKPFLQLIPVILYAGGCNVETHTDWDDCSW